MQKLQILSCCTIIEERNCSWHKMSSVCGHWKCVKKGAFCDWKYVIFLPALVCELNN